MATRLRLGALAGTDGRQYKRLVMGKSAVSTAYVAPETGSPRPTALLRYWGIVFIWMALISTLSSNAFSAQNTHHYIDPFLRHLFPGITTPQLLAAHAVVRKLAHFSEFFILGWLIFWAARRGRMPRWRAAWLLQAIALSAAYALLDEARQALSPDRTPSLNDSAIDTLGAATGQLLLYLRHRWFGT